MGPGCLPCMGCVSVDTSKLATYSRLRLCRPAKTQTRLDLAIMVAGCLGFFFDHESEDLTWLESLNNKVP
jgi:hypothetical protein